MMFFVLGSLVCPQRSDNRSLGGQSWLSVLYSNGEINMERGFRENQVLYGLLVNYEEMVVLAPPPSCHQDSGCALCRETAVATVLHWVSALSLTLTGRTPCTSTRSSPGSATSLIGSATYSGAQWNTQ